MKVKELFEETINKKVNIQNNELIYGHFPSKYNFEGIDLEGDFFCYGCHDLTTLKGSPKSVSGKFYCYECFNLTSLEGAPISTRIFDCSKCIRLTSLEGAPMSTESFDCSDCIILTSLKGIGKDYLTSIDGNIHISKSINSNILGILKIKKLTRVVHTFSDNRNLTNAISIINKHLKDRDIVKCKQELIEAGLKEFAKL